MPHSKTGRKKSPKHILALPDLEHAKTAVLNSLSSASGQRTYEHAIREFVGWYCSEPGASDRQVERRAGGAPLRERENRGTGEINVSLRVVATRDGQVECLEGCRRALRSTCRPHAQPAFRSGYRLVHFPCGSQSRDPTRSSAQAVAEAARTLVPLRPIRRQRAKAPIARRDPGWFEQTSQILLEHLDARTK